MKILFIGDISGKPGRKTVAKVLPELKTKYKPDLVIANCENVAGGMGVTKEKLTELQAYGIDFFTSGDHVWRVKSFVEEMYDTSLPLVRPYNYENSANLPGKGYDIIDLGPKGKITVINLLGQSFIRDIPRNPFWAIDELLDKLGLQDGNKETVIVDFHAETTAEKLCMASYLQNRVTALLGTHTHVPTADARLMGDMGYVTDVGMVGPLDASLWIKFDSAIHNFKYPFKKKPEMEEEGRMVFNSVLLEIKAGKTTSIQRIDKIL